MKKFIYSALAAGGLAFGGAAAAQDFGSVVTNILGSFGFPVYNTPPVYSNGIPAVVAQQPYGAHQVYTDPYGRQYYYDQYGRQVLVQQLPPRPLVYGTTTVYDQWGRPMAVQPAAPYAYPNYAYSATPSDRDGDGVANIHDRWPDDRRYR